MVLPWVFYQEDIAGEDVGDLEFIQEKVDAGNYFQVSGDINALSDTISFIPASGKTAYMIEAKITISDNPSAISTSTSTGVSTKDMIAAALKIGGTTKDETTIGVAANAGISSSNQRGGGTGSGFGNIGDGRFNVLGLSLVGTGSATIVIENILDNGTAFATFSGYLV